MNNLDHHDDDLLAAYALDAVDRGEAKAVDLHLRACGRCQGIVADFRATAAHLAAGSAPAPAGLWDAIASQLESGKPQALTLRALSPLRRRGHDAWHRALVGSVAAAVAVSLGLGAQLVAQGQRIEDMQAALEDRTILSAALAAEGHPDARRAELRTADGRRLAHAVITPEGTGFLRASSLAALPTDRTYQLWVVVGTERISAGLLGTRPEVVPFQVAGKIIGLAVTDEVAGGVVASEHQPVATGLVVEA